MALLIILSFSRNKLSQFQGMYLFPLRSYSLTTNLASLSKVARNKNISTIFN